MSLAVKLFHIGALGLYMYVIYCLYIITKNNISPDDPNAQLLKRFSARYLTNWTFGAQTIYFVTCILGYFFSSFPKLHKVREKLDDFKHSFFTTIAAPMAFVVTIVFWVIFNIDRELVFPKWIDRIIPLWINHAIHSFNSIIPILDMCLVKHKFPSYFYAMKSICAYIVAYTICLFGTYFQTGMWLYPLLTELTWPQRVLLAIFGMVLAMALYTLLFVFSKVLWGTQNEAPAKQITSCNGRQSQKKSA